MRFILYTILFALLISCHPKIINTKTTTVRDSLVIKEVHHRDTIRIKGDAVTSIIYQRDTVIKERQGRAELDIVKKNGITTAKCKCDSIQKALDIVLKDTARYKFTTTKEIRTVEVKVIPAFYKFTFWAFWIFVAIISGGLIYRFRKMLPPPINWIP